MTFGTIYLLIEICVITLTLEANCGFKTHLGGGHKRSSSRRSRPKLPRLRFVHVEGLQAAAPPLGVRMRTLEQEDVPSSINSRAGIDLTKMAAQQYCTVQPS